MSSFFKYKKNGKLALILCIALIVQMVITGVLAVAASTRQRESFNNLAIGRFSVVYEAAHSKLNILKENVKKQAQLNDIESYNFDENSIFTAVFQKISNDNVRFKIKSNTKIHNAKLNLQNFDSEKDVLYGKIVDLFTDTINPPTDLYIYIFDGKSTYYALKAQEFLGTLDVVSENILLLTGDVIAADFKGELTGMSLVRAFNQQTQSQSSESGQVAEVDLKNYGVSIMVSNNLIGELFVASYSPLTEQYALMTATVLRFALLGILTIIIYSCAFVIHQYSQTHIKIFSNNMVIQVDSYGKLLKAPRRFKLHFGNVNIFNRLNYNHAVASKILMSGLPITAELVDMHGILHTYYLLPNKVKKGYMLLLKKVPESIASVITTTGENELGIENSIKLHQDIKTLQLSLHEGASILILFELKNIGNYRLMFGSEFYKQIKKNFAQMLLTRLYEKGSVYNFDYEQFCFLSFKRDSTEWVKKNIEELMREFNMPIAIADNTIKIDCLAGAVDVTEQTINDLLNYASLALVKAQDLNKTYNIYDTTTGIYTLSRAKKLHIVQEIIQNGDIIVNFQPQFNTSLNRVAGFESLTRITGKHSSALKIQEFIELAEQGGLMIVLGDLIFDKAFQFAKSIQYYNAVVSLNVSPIQLMQAGFVKSFLEKYKSYNLKAGSISIEITETFLMTSFDETVQKLDILNKNGIHIHLDDFGVAYSSMLYLKKLPITTIKIDREFVSDIENNNYSRVICSKIIDIATELKLDVIAEGVETEAQKNILSELHCDIIQGYYISPAITSEKAHKLLNKYNIK